MLVGKKLNMTWLRALAAQKAKCVLGYTESSTGSRAREGIPLLHSMRHHLDYWVLLWGPQCEMDTNLLQRVQRKTRKMIRGLRHLYCEDRLRELGLFSLEVYLILKKHLIKNNEGNFLNLAKKHKTKKNPVSNILWLMMLL